MQRSLKATSDEGWMTKKHVRRMAIRWFMKQNCISQLIVSILVSIHGLNHQQFNVLTLLEEAHFLRYYYKKVKTSITNDDRYYLVGLASLTLFFLAFWRTTISQLAVLIEIIRCNTSWIDFTMHGYFDTKLQLEKANPDGVDVFCKARVGSMSILDNIWLSHGNFNMAWTS